MTARLLTTLALALPLAACAAQPGSGQAAGQESRAVVRAPAAVEPAPTAAPAEPAAAPAPQATRHIPPVTSSPAPAPASAHPRAVAGTGAPSAAAPAQAPAQAPIAQPDTAAAPTGTAAPANPAAPDVVAPRPAAPGIAVPPVAMPAGSSTGSLLQTLFALILVLAVLGALAWFLKRYGPKVGGGNANLRVVGSLNLGGRERIVVVEVGNEWIVVGASPGRINALATMPRQDGQNGDTNTADAALAPHAPAAHSFADWLKQTIDKRK
jgi:flagellar biosynthetic protein FliO